MSKCSQRSFRSITANSPKRAPLLAARLASSVSTQRRGAENAEDAEEKKYGRKKTEFKCSVALVEPASPIVTDTRPRPQKLPIQVFFLLLPFSASFAFSAPLRWV